MVRQKDNTVKAFYNVCQHRGNPLVEEKKGHVLRRFVCKYHSWAFLPDGELNFAPDKEDFLRVTSLRERSPGRASLRDVRRLCLGQYGPGLCVAKRVPWPDMGRLGEARNPLATHHGKDHVAAL